jgi:hypothetical protein
MRVRADCEQVLVLEVRLLSGAVLELWAITVIAALTGAVGSLLNKRGVELDAAICSGIRRDDCLKRGNL